MKRMMALAAMLALLGLGGCAGMYAGGDLGGHTNADPHHDSAGSTTAGS